MANTVKMKQSAVAGKVPTTAQLALGELAINTVDGKLYLKKNVSGTESIVDVTAASSGGIPSGAVMLFGMASAPVGWTQIVTDAADNRMLRVVKTTGAGTGGSHSPILNNVVPAHTHGFTTGNASADHSHAGWTGGVNSNHSHAQHGSTYGDYGSGTFINSGGSARYFTTANFDGAGKLGTDGHSNDHAHYITTGGASATHTHSGTTDNGSSQTNWTPRYVDLIMCSKN